MKPVHIMIIALSYSVNINAQDYDLPDRNLFHPDWESWESFDNSVQVSYHENGKIKLDYEVIDDDHKWRKEYYKNGSLKSKVKIRQSMGNDTLTTINYETYEEVIEVRQRIHDEFDGEYLEYFESKRSGIKPRLKTKGQYVSGKKSGTWTTFNDENRKIEFNYKNGGLAGLYREYYKGGKAVKYEGMYDVVLLKLTDYSSDTYELKSIERKESRRVGTWTYFDREGQIIETVEYKGESK